MFPSPLEIVVTRIFPAPIALVFDVFTKAEHVRKTFAPFGETVTVCDIDLRVGGSYHYVMVTDTGAECSFCGTFLEIAAPHRAAQTWHFGGWPGVEAVEAFELKEIGGMTDMTWKLTFRDQAGRDHMKKFDGILSNFEIVHAHLASLVD